MWYTNNMKRIIFIIVFVLVALNSVWAQLLPDDPELSLETKPLPPYSVKKVFVNEKFTPFEFIDLNGKKWTNRGEMKRSLLILTGKWALRHDIKKWANHLAYKYANFCDIIWVFNPDGTEFANHRQRFADAMKHFNMAVAVVNDEHAIIGRSLKIEYDIPTIIGITRHNTLAFVYESPMNKTAIDKVEMLMFSRMFR